MEHNPNHQFLFWNHKSLRSACVLLIANRPYRPLNVDVKVGGALGVYRKEQVNAGTGFLLRPSSPHIHHSPQEITYVHLSQTPYQPYSYTFCNMPRRSGAEIENKSQFRLYPMYSGAQILKRNKGRNQKNIPYF